MFARVFALLPLALLVSASHLEARDQCNTGSISCCKSTENYSAAEGLLQALDLVGVVADVTALVGLSCSSVTVVGNGCAAQQQPLCCENNYYNGLINIGCTPINL